MEIEATFNRLVWDYFHFKAAFDVECANVSATVGSCAGISHPTFGAFPDTEYRDSCHNMRVHCIRVPAHIRGVCVFDVATRRRTAYSWRATYRPVPDQNS